MESLHKGRPFTDKNPSELWKTFSKHGNLVINIQMLGVLPTSSKLTRFILIKGTKKGSVEVGTTTPSLNKT